MAVRVERSGGVMTLVLDRPEKRNALNAAMYAAMADALDAAAADETVRAVLVRGEGEGFTAGNDIAEFARAGAAMGGVLRFLRALADAEKPLVAAAHGRAVGIGTTMLLHCDHVVLSDDALLSAPFVDLGLVPEAGSSLLLPARIGHGRAYRMFALGEVVGAADAVAWGLADRVVPPAELVDAANDVARRLAAKPAGALAATKRLMRDAAGLRARIDAEAAVFRERLASAEAQEAFAAFAERRPPDFTGLSGS